jgi:ankyrin repeat protein
MRCLDFYTKYRLYEIFNINLKAGNLKLSPLHIACAFNYADIAVLLIDAGANIF